MLSATLWENNCITKHLQETFVPVEAPQLKTSQQLLAFWQVRPADGIAVGRDIPSRRIAPLLSHLILWEPIDDGKDYVVRHMGETLRSRFGGYVVGRKMSELLSAELYAFYVDRDLRLTKNEDALVLDVTQSHNGCNYLHYELVVFPARSPDRRKTWLVVGAFYF